MLCLPKENSDAFKKALKDGTLKIPDLIKMTTEERTSAFSDVVGKEYAESVNTTFEKKLMLKNQQAGLIDWIKDVGGLKPAARADLIARVQKMDKVFNPDDAKTFLNDVADQALGTSVTREEAKHIFELSKKVEEAKTYTGVKDIDSLVKSFEDLDQSTLTVPQKKAIADLRQKIDAEKAAEQAEIDRIKAERQASKDKIEAERKAAREKNLAEKKAIQEQKNKEREAVREQNRKEREDARIEAREKKIDKYLEEKTQKDLEDKLVKEQEKIEREQAKEEARLEKEIADEEARFDRQEKLDQEKFDREAERAEKIKTNTDLQTATGESLKKLKQTFTKITNTKFKSIDQFSPKMKAQLEDITAKREAIANGQDRMVYGRAKVQLENYVTSLTEKTIREQFTESPLESTAGLAKSLKSTLDNSVLGRQGIKTLFTNPTLWLPNAAKSFKDIYDTFGGKAVMDEIRADIVSRPNYEEYKKMKLAVNTREEAHPSSLVERVPYLGKIAQASENAFGGFLHRMRADLADAYLELYKKNGIVMDKAEYESLGKLINSQTARGGLGKLEGIADTANMAFFSLRKMKADLDTLTLHAFDKDFTKTARKQAAINLVKIIGGLAIILGIAKALDPNSVEFDPRSADFGKIKIGDTRFDVTGGMSSLVTLASRVSPVLTFGLIKPASKSSVTGKINPINSDAFGAQSVTDVIGDFMANKESPALALVHHLLNQKDNQGNPITPAGELGNLFVPLPISNAMELAKDPHAANFFLGMIADSLGIGTNSYAPSGKQQHDQQVADLVKKNYEAKQSGKPTKSVNEIAKEVYGDGADSTQKGAIVREMAFYKAFGGNNKWANEIKDDSSAADVIQSLADAKDELGDAEFKKFYEKARGDVDLPSGGTSQVLISNPLDVKWQAYLKDGTMPADDSTTGQSTKERTLLNIISTAAKAIGTSPGEAFKLILENQSIRRIDNGQIIINRNSHFFDRQLGTSGYSDSVRKALDAGKDQKLDHTVPVEGGGLDEASDLALISTAEWKKNSVVENMLGKALRSGRITGDQLREYAIRYKAGRGQAISPELQKEYQKQYGGVPLTQAEIADLLKK